MRNSFLVLFILLSCQLIGQNNAIIRGYILDEQSGDPISFANVNLISHNIGTSTDNNGFFSIGGLSEGTKNLFITYLGYDTLEITIELGQSDIYFQNFFIKESGISLGIVSISAAKQQAKTEVQISKLSISTQQIKSMPSIGGTSDILQYLQVIPGVISTGDQGGQVYIRGGSPIQNKILLDGLTIYNPFHSIGFFSVFDTDLIRNMDVYTGGFSAEYGGRISAIVDIQTRDGNKKEFGGQIGVNPFLVNILAEGPIVPIKENGGSTSFLLSTKKSVIAQTSPLLYNHLNVNDSVGLPFNFTDYYGKLSFINQNGSKLNVFGFNFIDGYNNPSIADLNWYNAGGGADFRLIPGNSDFILNGMVGYTDYGVTLTESDGAPRESSIKGFTALIDFSLFENRSELNYGLEFNSFQTNFRFQNPFRIILGQSQNTTEIGGYMKYRISLGSLVLEPSFRGQYYASLGEFSPEPRIGIKYNFNEYIRIKGAAGRYSQNLLEASNERDVVSLFTGFLSGPEERIFKLGSSEVASRNIQIATHYIAGLEVDLTSRLSLNMEGYYKDFNQIIIVNRNKLLGSDPNFATEEGSAYGFDIAGNYKGTNLSFQANYALGYVFRYDGEQEYPPVFDRRHNVNVLGSYSLGSNLSWTISLRWNMGSGFPFTRTQGFYNYNPFNDGLGTNYLQDNPEVIGIIYEENRNAGRLPYYHRLDLSVSKKIILFTGLDMDIDISVTNVYNRENIFYFDRITYDRVNQLPLLASAGVKFNF